MYQRPVLSFINLAQTRIPLIWRIKASEYRQASQPRPCHRMWRNEVMKMGRIIAACGNDCSACPRYVSRPYEKSPEGLHRTAELWMRIGYRDHVVSIEEISCTGCRSENWCRYSVVKCCAGRGIETCAECAEFPCEKMRECFEVTKSFEPTCRQVCSDEEYEQLRKAFFEKEENLTKLQSRLSTS